MSTQFASARSTYIKGLEWTGERISYPEAEIKGDTFPMTWAEDGEIYTSAGDPLWGETVDGLDVEKFSGGATDCKITKVNPMNDYRGWGVNGLALARNGNAIGFRGIPLLPGYGRFDGKLPLAALRAARLTPVSRGSRRSSGAGPPRAARLASSRASGVRA